MVTVAVLCVFFGVVDSALFGLLPYDVTSEAVVSHAYTTYTVDHIVEGLALAVAGLVGFVLVKKPLSRVKRVPDVDDLYNPAVLYGSRALVVGTTELYAAVDRTAVATTRLAHTVVTDPRSVLARLGDGEPTRLTADIGTSIVLVTLVLAVTVAVLLI
jgi:multicomponent Na+:H+ antiporter subunit D